MKLNFCRHSYEFPAPLQLGFASEDQPQIKLICRGHTYDYTPRSVIVSEAVEIDRSKVTLIYRGNTYERNLKSPKFYPKPRAINWRYQIPAEGLHAR
jgi:hypothetical protein